MTTPEREREAHALAAIYLYAANALSVDAATDAQRLGLQMTTRNAATTGPRFLSTVVASTMGSRSLGLSLAVAFLRLFRALMTGFTFNPPGEQAPARVDVRQLRSRFYDLANEATRRSNRAILGTPPPTPIPSTVREGIQVEALDQETEREIAELDELHERQMTDLYQTLGPNLLEKKAQDLDTTLPADEVDERRDAEERTVRSRLASAGGWAARTGGRGILKLLGEKDSRQLGFARVSQTGTPCGFCAMLISRGPVYKSERSATLANGAARYEDQNKYHLNCRCEAVPVYTDAQFNDHPIFDLNRRYMELWPEVTRGTSGKQALAVWRKYIRENTSPAQEAGSDNAQEAA